MSVSGFWVLANVVITTRQLLLRWTHLAMFPTDQATINYSITSPTIGQWKCTTINGKYCELINRLCTSNTFVRQARRVPIEILLSNCGMNRTTNCMIRPVGLFICFHLLAMMVVVMISGNWRLISFNWQTPNQDRRNYDE